MGHRRFLRAGQRVIGRAGSLDIFLRALAGQRGDPVGDRLRSSLILRAGLRQGVPLTPSGIRLAYRARSIGRLLGTAGLAGAGRGRFRPLAPAHIGRTHGALRILGLFRALFSAEALILLRGRLSF